MIGPTGVGKTEIARRIAKLTNAPFIKVEATKFTEVGYVGRDVESMVRDLVEASRRLVKEEMMEAVQEQAEKMANEALVKLLVPSKLKEKMPQNPFEMLFGQQQEEQKQEYSTRRGGSSFSTCANCRRFKSWKTRRAMGND